MWSWVPRDSDPRKTALVRACSIYKRQTRPLVRECAPQNKTVTVKQQQISGHEPQMGLDTMTFWLTDRQSQCDVDFGSCSRWFLVSGFFYPEDGGDTFLRNVGLHGATSQKTAFLIATAAKTLNLTQCLWVDTIGFWRWCITHSDWG
jgi:hypothetical protein